MELPFRRISGSHPIGLLTKGRSSRIILKTVVQAATLDTMSQQVSPLPSVPASLLSKEACKKIWFVSFSSRQLCVNPPRPEISQRYSKRSNKKVNRGSQKE
mmetsp:Transcript_17989/g.43598  ORF Transcript_17989/g.43598 Transcript_17989/m.43598 type:complete len:101 (+) Transcript_17989:574-876(+)